MTSTHITVEIPQNLKNEILDIVNFRKKQGKGNGTQKVVVIELLEKGLAVFKQEKKENVKLKNSKKEND